MIHSFRDQLTEDIFDGQTKMIPQNRPSHPGEFIREYILDEFDLTQEQLALRLGVERKTISWLVNGKGKMSAAMAWRLGKFTNTTPQMWINLQTTLDLWEALNAFSDQEIDRIEPILA